MTNIEDGYSYILHDPQRVSQFVQQKVDSKIRWYQQHHQFYEGKSWASWQDKILDYFYKGNLSIEVPDDGEVICRKGHILIIDVRGRCPILEACVQNGDNTMQVCSTLYHVQYQALLSLIEPGLIFARDYSQLRPDADHCREVIVYRPDTVRA
jgi:hypothetical protein